MTAATGRAGTIRIPKPCYLFALVAGDLVAVRDRFTTRSGRDVALAIWVRDGDQDALRSRDGQPEDLDGVGRGGVRPGIRSGRVQHRRRVRLQHGGDGEQGAERLQHEIRPGPAGYRDRRRLPGHRDGDRPRILPQLDRQPHHLPRLVPVEPEGRPDGVPRPAVHDGPGQCGGEAAGRRARPAGGTVHRGCRADGPSGAAGQLRGDRQFLHRDGLPEGRRGGAHAAHHAGRRTASGAAWTCTCARHDNQAVTIEDFVSAMSDGGGVDLSAFLGWYAQAGTPTLHRVRCL